MTFAPIPANAARAAFTWAFVAQAFSSGANFGLFVIAGRLLGPAGLGVVFIGFAVYQLVAGLQRAVITQPLIAHAAPLSPSQRHSLAACGLTVVGASGTLATIALFAAGLAVEGRVGRGLLIFAPWLIPALLQEFWKAMLFQEGRAALGAASDCVRFSFMILSLPLALAWKNPYVVVTIWGLGSAAGLILEAAVFWVRPRRLRPSLVAWRQKTWKLGRWLGMREIVYQLLATSTVLILAAVIGARDLGGLRSAEALFSPFSLIAAALILPTLPALSRAVAVSHEKSLHLTVRISVGATALGLAYFLVMAMIGSWLLVHLFGHAFSSFSDLIWPMAVAQLFYAGSFSFNALLSAQKRGAASFIAGVVWAAATVGCTTVLAIPYGVMGAAWGMAAGAGIGSIIAIRLGRQKANHPQSPSPTRLS